MLLDIRKIIPNQPETILKPSSQFDHFFWKNENKKIDAFVCTDTKQWECDSRSLGLYEALIIWARQIVTST